LVISPYLSEMPGTWLLFFFYISRLVITKDLWK
jgi:hypothetical protein